MNNDCTAASSSGTIGCDNTLRRMESAATTIETTTTTMTSTTMPEASTEEAVAATGSTTNSAVAVATATATSEDTKTVNTNNTTSNNYQITEAAMKPLREARQYRPRGGIPGRNHSNNSNKSAGGNLNLNNSNHSTSPVHHGTSNNNNNNPLDVSRFSHRSSTTSSMWSAWLGRGRRIYGSTTSVASSITLPEFDGEEFELSEHSLDLRYLHIDDDEEDNDDELKRAAAAEGNLDSQPTIPQRQVSVAAGQSSSLLSMATNSDHTQQLQQQLRQQQKQLQKLLQSSSSPPPPPAQQQSIPRPLTFRSSDLSPRQPGRKLSIQTILSGDSSAVTTAAAAPFAPDADAAHAKKCVAPKPKDPPFGRCDSKDSIPQHPNRKKSSKIMEEDVIAIQEEADEDGVDALSTTTVGSQPLSDLSSFTTFQEAIEECLKPHALLPPCNGGANICDNTFTGEQAMAKMMETNLVTSRQEGLELGQAMLDAGNLFRAMDHANNNHNDTTQKPIFADTSQDIYVLSMTRTMEE